MAGQLTQPILVREGTVIATAVGVPDPSLTLVEFEHGVGFLLAGGFQADGFRARYYLEQVMLWRTGDPLSVSECHRLVLLGGERDLPDDDVVTGADLQILSTPWPPAVFFLSESERTRLLRRLEDHDPQRVLREAFSYAHRTEELRSHVLKLKDRWEEELRGFHILDQRMQPKKETVHISLPPKPALAKDTVHLELPPRSAKPGVKDSVSPTLPLETSPSAKPIPTSLDQITAAFLEEQLGNQSRLKNRPNEPHACGNGAP